MLRTGWKPVPQKHVPFPIRARILCVVQERLQKILSARGICSRRKAEEYIVQGLVKVNGTPSVLGQKADPEKDRIEVEGAVLGERMRMRYYLMNKPVGVVTSNVEKTGTGPVFLADGREKNRTCPGFRTVRNLLPPEIRGKVYPVGRLDKDTSGLLLFTNDGVLAYRLTHPKFDHEKEYEVMTERPVTDGQLRKLREGMTISGEKTKRASVERLGAARFMIALTEGRNRQIRRMCQKVGCPVKDLRRKRIMTLEDPRLREGEVRELSEREREELLQSVGISATL